MPDPKQRFVRLAAVLREHHEQVARVGEEARQAFADYEDRTPPRLQLRGIGGILHDFYTGIERLFERIAPELNGGLPAGPSWHRSLLQEMTLELPGVRPPVLRPETARQLEELLRFRHLFRNLYGFELEWPRMRALLESLPDVWRAVDADLHTFLEFLDQSAESS